MSDAIFQEIKDELLMGVSSPEHPFKFCTLGTVGLENVPRLRTIALRQVDQDLGLRFYTDTRSKKILHLKENNRASLLFYHPKKRLQLRVEGLASIVKDPDSLKGHWQNVGRENRRDYTTKKAPGSDISDPDHIEYLEDENHFCMVNLQPFKIEYLKLKQPHHVRVRFSMKESGWQADFLVP